MPSFSQIVNSCWHLYFLLLKICAFFHGSKFRDFFPPSIYFPTDFRSSFSCTLLYLLLQIVNPFYCSSNYKKSHSENQKHVLKNGVSAPHSWMEFLNTVWCALNIIFLCAQSLCDHSEHYRPRLQYRKDLQIFTWFHFCAITATRKICKIWLQITLEISNCR